MKRGFAALALLAALLLLSALALAQGGEIEIDGAYYSPASPQVRHWTFTYCDDWFMQPSTAYDHRLARASIGMAVASFRRDDPADGNIRSFLTQAGFDNLVAID